MRLLRWAAWLYSQDKHTFVMLSSHDPQPKSLPQGPLDLNNFYFGI
jgi:hypothetical protein